MGNTRVICGVMIDEAVPRWMKEQGVIGGWLTAEYSMLPYATSTRKPRDITKGRLDGRSTEIQRLIGRALRAVVDLEKLGPRTIRKLVAAVSAGVMEGSILLDLDYEEDKAVSVDFNFVATEEGEFVELQGSGEEATFSQMELEGMLQLGRKGIAELIEAQRRVLAGVIG